MEEDRFVDAVNNAFVSMKFIKSLTLCVRNRHLHSIKGNIHFPEILSKHCCKEIIKIFLCDIIQGRFGARYTEKI